jgi:hypothetical protein
LNTASGIIWLSGNKYIFGDFVNKPWLSVPQLVYAPQQNIKLNKTSNTLSVSTGVADNVQNFEWSKDGVVLTTNQNSSYQTTVSGKYTCRIKHNTLTIAANADRNLILQTDTLNVLISGMTEGVLNVDYFNIFPNPSRHIVNIEAQFKQSEAIDMTVSNALGQVVVSRKYNGLSVKETLDVSSFSEGIYQITLKTASGRITRSVTVIK